MKKIVIKEKKNFTNYFEVSYVFILDLPQAQIDAETKLNSALEIEDAVPTVTEKSGVASYKNGTTLKSVQDDLIAKYNEEQNKKDVDDTKAYFGMSWDGSSWS